METPHPMHPVEAVMHCMDCHSELVPCRCVPHCLALACPTCEPSNAGVQPVPADEGPLARLDRAADLLEQLVALVPTSSMQTHEAQESLHGAAALLVEIGRGQPDRLRDASVMWLADEKRGGGR